MRARLEETVRHARLRSPFYRGKYASLPREIRDIGILPSVSKRELMENFDAWATDPAVRRETADAFVADPSRIGQLYLDRYVAFSSSGTTGSPVILLQDSAAMTVYQALFLERRIPSLLSARDLFPLLKCHVRIATIIATGGHFASSVVDARARVHWPRLYGRNRTFSLMSPMPELVDALNDYRPAVVGTYPTALAVLAEEQAAGRLRIRPALLLSGAERLSRPLAERISAAFRCPVRDTYAASEFMGIAFDCRLGRMHVNADWVVLEPVDAEGRPSLPGEPSRTTLLTNLANRLQPLIRYDLGDSVTTMPERCPCGSPLPVVRPEGRRDETLRVEREDGTSVPLLPLVLATVIEETTGLSRYQLLQAGPSALRLRFEEAPGLDRAQVGAEAERRLRAYLSSVGVGAVSIERSEERPQVNPSGGKTRSFLVERSSTSSRSP
ncbi:MAG: phenylacetate--CoA ligase family protein [Thermodesulfobacteriota bacterium]